MSDEKPFNAAPIKPLITFEDIEKLDIRVGLIERVEDVPKSDKLVRMTVNFGDHTRQSRIEQMIALLKQGEKKR